MSFFGRLFGAKPAAVAAAPAATVAAAKTPSAEVVKAGVLGRSLTEGIDFDKSSTVGTNFKNEGERMQAYISRKRLNNSKKSTTPFYINTHFEYQDTERDPTTGAPKLGAPKMFEGRFYGKNAATAIQTFKNFRNTKGKVAKKQLNAEGAKYLKNTQQAARNAAAKAKMNTYTAAGIHKPMGLRNTMKDKFSIFGKKQATASVNPTPTNLKAVNAAAPTAAGAANQIAIKAAGQAQQAAQQGNAAAAGAAAAQAQQAAAAAQIPAQAAQETAAILQTPAAAAAADKAVAKATEAQQAAATATAAAVSVGAPVPPAPTGVSSSNGKATEAIRNAKAAIAASQQITGGSSRRHRHAMRSRGRSRKHHSRR